MNKKLILFHQRPLKKKKKKTNDNILERIFFPPIAAHFVARACNSPNRVRERQRILKKHAKVNKTRKQEKRAKKNVSFVTLKSRSRFVDFDTFGKKTKTKTKTNNAKRRQQYRSSIILDNQKRRQNLGFESNR
jgi:hypothetical protein